MRLGATADLACHQSKDVIMQKGPHQSLRRGHIIKRRAEPSSVSRVPTYEGKGDVHDLLLLVGTQSGIMSAMSIGLRARSLETEIREVVGRGVWKDQSWGVGGASGEHFGASPVAGMERVGTMWLAAGYSMRQCCSDPIEHGRLKVSDLLSCCSKPTQMVAKVQV